MVLFFENLLQIPPIFFPLIKTNHNPINILERKIEPGWKNSQQKAKSFSDRNFLEKQKAIKYLSLNDFCVSSRHWARLGSNLPTIWRIFFFTFSMFEYYYFIIWEYLLILPKKLEMPSTGTPKIPRFKINVSMCECCCPFFIYCLFLAFQRNLRTLTTQKSLITMHLMNFYK